MTGEINNEKPNMNTTDEKIEKQQKFFKWYYRLPLIILIATLVAAFVIGIVDAVEEFLIGYELEGAAWIIWMLIGGVIGTLEYFIAKIAYSQKILTVLYLQKLNEDKQ